IQAAGAGNQVHIGAGGDIANSGVIHAQGDTHLASQANIVNSGTITAFGNTALSAAGRIDSAAGALLAGGVNPDNTLRASGDLTLDAQGAIGIHGVAASAGATSIHGAAADLSDANLSGARIAIGTSQGDLDASRAVIGASDTLGLDAARLLRTDGGRVIANQLTLAAHDVSNAGGDIMQLGGAELAIRLPGQLDNSAGRIASNSNQLTLQAATLSNAGGKIEHAGSGALSLSAITFNDQRGQIGSNGALVLKADTLDHRGASTVAAQLALDAGTLDNRGGAIGQTGAGQTALHIHGGLDNRGGTIDTNGALALAAATLHNGQGRIAASDSASVGVLSSLDNSGGVLAAAGGLTLAAGDVNNSRGQIQAIGGAAALAIGGLNNDGGSISAGSSLDLGAANINNSGSLYAAGNQTVHASGALVNSGAIAARGHTTIAAASIDSAAGSLLGAGINAAGGLLAGGDLTITASGGISALGQNLAAGNASLGGASVDVSGSQTSAANLALTAHAGNVLTSHASVSTAGRLAINAGAGQARALINAQGSLSAGQLAVQAANLDNRGGSIVQTGRGDTAIVLTAPDGRLDNSGGRIAVNSANLALGAATLANTGGKIEHAGAGALTIRATALDGARGSITGNGLVDIGAVDIDHDQASTSGQQVTLHAASLSNRDGRLLQTGAGPMTVAVVRQLDNSGGAIVANGDLRLQAGALANARGRITAALAARVDSGGALDNSDGVIAAGAALQLSGTAIGNERGLLQAATGALTLQAASLSNRKGTLSAGSDLTATVAGDVRNDGVLYAGRDQHLDVGGTLDNSGSIAALRDTTLRAGDVRSSGLLGAGLTADGSLLQSGKLTVGAARLLQAGGQNLAAGDLLMSGAALDLSGSQTSAANIALTAAGGDIGTGNAVLSTAGLLAITAHARNGQTLLNQGGKLSAGQLQLALANLDNRGGAIVQTGSGDTAIETGLLDNGGGRIAVNSANLTLNARDLNNQDGKIEHAGAGTLAIRADNFDGQRGQLSGNGALDLAATYLDHRNASTVARQVTLSAGVLDNRNGDIVQLGQAHTSIRTSQRLDNGGGKIETNGDAAIDAALLLNGHGGITAGQSMRLDASAGLDNSDGTIAAGRDLALGGANLDNSRGSVRAVAGNAVLTIGDLNNSAGTVFAGARLDTTAANVVNSGSLYAGASQTLTASGAISNSGVILAQGNNTISANSLDSSAASLIGAGLKADGAFNAGGDLNIQTRQGLRANGQNLAAGSASLAGASLDIGASQTSAATISLSASSGNVGTSAATLTTPGLLTVSAQANPGQTWDNSQGTVSAGQLALRAANLNNSHGSLVQSGAGATRIDTGSLDNTSGRIAVNSANLTLAAATLLNTDGKIEHAGNGALVIQADRLNGQRGQITSNGGLSLTAATLDHRNASTIAQQVTIAAGTLDNRQGEISQLGFGQAGIRASVSLDNRGGSIASNGNTAIAAQSLNNQGGKLQAGGGASLDLGGGTLDNSNAGDIGAGGKLTAALGALLNQNGKITAGGALDAAIGGTLQNAGGLLAATGNLAVAAGALDNRGGKVASVQGDIKLSSGAIALNDGGAIQAAGDIAIVGAGLSNTLSGSIAGRNVSIDTGLAALDNSIGTIVAAQALNVRSGALDNDGGLLQSGAGLSIDTHGQALNNANALSYARNLGNLQGNPGGIVSGAGLNLAVGDWSNRDGYVGAAGAVTGHAGLLDNRGGRIAGQSSLALSLAGLNNQNGQWQVVGKLNLDVAGVIDNRQGLIRSGAAATLNAAAIDNSATQGSNQGLEGIDLTISAGSLNNRQGALRADHQLTFSGSGAFDNSLGLLSAGTALSVRDDGASRSLVISNGGGTVIAGTLAEIRAASLGGDGRILSQQDLTLDLSGNYIHGAGGEITANRNLGLTIAGDFVNAGKLQAGGTLTLGAVNLDNTASGDISAATTRVSASGVLNNRGLIDGVATELNAGTLNNLGTGRLYGSQLSIAAATLNNDVENGVAATIAARENLNIGAQVINNREHALIFSGNDMAIAGALDAKRQASGSAAVLNNASASIEALGSLSLAAEHINNLNSHFEVAMSGPSGPQNVTEYQGKGVAQRYAAGTPGVEVYNDESDHLRTPDNTYEEWNRYDIVRTTRQSEVVSSDPGRITAGRNISINAGQVLNDNSHLIAGGLLDLHGMSVSNSQTAGQKITSDSGIAHSFWRNHKRGRDDTGHSSTGYAPPDQIETISLNVAREQQLAAPQGSGTTLANVAIASVDGATSAAGSASADVKSSAIVKALAGLGGVGNASGHGAAAASAGSGPQGSERTGNAGQAGGVDAATGAVAGAVSGVGANHQTTLAPAAGASVGGASGGAVQVDAANGAPRQVRLNGIAQVALAHPSGGAQVVRSSPASVVLPNASLFKISPAPSSHYLVETDPRFANYRAWTGSDYLLNQVKADPSVTQKRLGDGFYEQQLVREQVAQLTGQRFAGDYSSDEQQYRGLMDSGAVYAKTWDLHPGVALTPAQMAALTSDIVWLVERDVTLADGSTQKALVPQVYLRLRDGDLDGSGSLLAGKEVNLNLSGDLTNSGTIAGREVVKLSAENVDNLGGRVHGDAVAVAARNDLNNIGGAMSANSQLIATAGRDLHIDSTSHSGSSSAGGNSFSRTGLDRVAGLYVTGDGSGGSGTLVAAAGRDVSLLAGVIGNAGQDGNTIVSAGRDINLGTLTTASANSLHWDANNYRKDSTSTDVGSQIQASGNIALQAGNDLNARAADVQAGQALVASAGHDVNLTAGINQTSLDEGHQHTEKGFLHSETITSRDTLERSMASGSAFGGNTVALAAGHDIKVTGSSILSDGAASLIAKHDITIAAATDSSTASQHRSVKESGFLSGGGFGISYGTRTTTVDQERDATSQSGQSRSAVGSTGGDVTIAAGGALNISGSDIAAGGDLDLLGKSVTITPGQDNEKGKFEVKTRQDG
ncbi:hemagglutinin repeat-containing protein, partial [Janthinobacterium agaricidamnosum]|uniref:hemagglutinin repeat-containing protein n=1 Tax=Janthinobacterium agaricidamnosum TaxID=55508 RepID=UPI0007740AA1